MGLYENRGPPKIDAEIVGFKKKKKGPPKGTPECRKPPFMVAEVALVSRALGEFELSLGFGVSEILLI